MNPDLLSAKLSMAVLAALIAAWITIIAVMKKREFTSDALYALAALGLIAFYGEAALGARLTDHAVAMWAYLAMAVLVAGAFLLKRITFPLASTLTLMPAMAYLFSPTEFWRSPLTLLLFVWCVFAAFGFARGEEAAPMIDEAFPGRLPLRQPPRIRGAREIALAIVTSALALIFGVALFWPAPPPVETPTAQEESVTSETAEAPTESQETKEAPVEEPASYTARAGDTFKSIAKQLYGDAKRARDIARVNPTIKPAVKLKAGQKIMLPTPAKQPAD